MRGTNPTRGQGIYNRTPTLVQSHQHRQIDRAKVRPRVKVKRQVLQIGQGIYPRVMFRRKMLYLSLVEGVGLGVRSITNPTLSPVRYGYCYAEGNYGIPFFSPSKMLQRLNALWFFKSTSSKKVLTTQYCICFTYAIKIHILLGGQLTLPLPR